MANGVVKFYRGPQASYNSTSHADGIYFATDTKKIIMNGTEYGGDSNKKVSNVALNANANGIVITYTDSTSTTLLLGKATVTADGLMSKKDKAKLDSLDPTASGSYESSLDPSVATVEKLGGINAGTTVAQLTGKSYDEIFDTLIFPTVNPTFVDPTVTISLKGYLNTQEVGANAPTAANFNTEFNQGQILVAEKEQAKRAGALEPENSYILYGSSQELPAKVVKGSMSYKYHAAYAQGPQPKDSKGNYYQTPLAAGSVDSGEITVTGYRAAYSGLVSTNAITEEVIKGMTKTVSAKKPVKVSGPISEQYICFAAPAGWTVSNIKDSNSFDATNSYTTSTVSVTGLDGQAVDYTVYLSSKMSQPSTYYVNFN